MSLPEAAAPRQSEEPPSDLRERLRAHDQEHLLQWWPELSLADRARLLDQLATLNLDLIDDLVERLVRHDEPHPIPIDRVRGVEVTRLPHTDAQRVRARIAAEVGEQMLEAGQVAVIVVAGGQGTRLGFDGPKGTYPIGPVSGASLFQVHAEKIRALEIRSGKTIPLYVMTSPDNHQATARFFAENGNFGLEHLRFFMQGRLPAVDRSSGRILLDSRGSLALSPDGHGGTLSALAATPAGGGPSCLDEMRHRGITTLFYFQVDNPMVKVAEPAYLGYHQQASAELSLKVVEKVLPDERVGVVVEIDSQLQVIEYSDLPIELAERRMPEGTLELWAGSIAIHVFSVAFIERLVAGSGELPYHRALKKVPYIDTAGQRIEPATPNAVKFERFIFDALPLARHWSIVETDRAVEFEPLKNAQGAESPQSVRQRMSDLYASWIEAAGIPVPRRPDGSAAVPIEISPLYALDAAELKRKLPADLKVDQPLLLRP